VVPLDAGVLAEMVDVAEYPSRFIGMGSTGWMMRGSAGTAGIGCIVGECVRGVEILCVRFLRPDLLIHLFQHVIAHNFLKLPFVHKLSRDLLVLVYAVDKDPLKSL